MYIRIHVHVYYMLHKTMYIPVSNLVTPTKKRERKRVMTKKTTRERMKRMMKLSSHEGREQVAA